MWRASNCHNNNPQTSFHFALTFKAKLHFYLRFTVVVFFFTKAELHFTLTDFEKTSPISILRILNLWEGRGVKHLLQSCLERLRQGKQAIILDVKWTLVQVACTDNVSEILAM